MNDSNTSPRLADLPRWLVVATFLLSALSWMLAAAWLRFERQHVVEQAQFSIQERANSIASGLTVAQAKLAGFSVSGADVDDTQSQQALLMTFPVEMRASLANLESVPQDILEALKSRPNLLTAAGSDRQLMLLSKRIEGVSALLLDLEATLLWPNSKEGLSVKLGEWSALELEQELEQDVLTATASTDFNASITLYAPMSSVLGHFYDSTVPLAIAVSTLLGFLSWALVTLSALAVSKLQSSQSRLTRLVALDSLTELPNRRTFSLMLQGRLAKAMRSGESLAVMFIDLDHFKEVNDTLGHASGDELLKEVSRRLASCVRAEDQVCRLGGDEFVVLLAELPEPSYAQEVGERIIGALSKPVTLRKREVHVGASIGIAVAPGDAKTADQLVANADLAVYRAKALGRSNVQFFDDSLRQEALRRMETTSAIRSVVENNRVSMVFQPICDIATGRAVSIEGLLRFSEPSLCGRPISDVLRDVTDNALKEQLFLSTVSQAARVFVKARNLGHGLTDFTVNTSGILLTPTLLESVVSSLPNGCPPSALTLEISQTAEDTLSEGCSQTYRILESLGIGHSVEDFARTGLSMDMLKRKSVKRIKLNVKSLHEAQQAASMFSIYAAILGRLTTLGVQTVACAAESQMDREFALEAGCSHIQGYVVASPLDPEALCCWLEKASAQRNAEQMIQPDPNRP